MDVNPAFLTAQWRFLVMLNFAIEPLVLESYVPRGTELDTWNGTIYVSLVALSFVDTKVKGFAIPLHRDFEEINLRFYVRSTCPERRRGVVFIREVVPRFAIALIAKWLYNENYAACPTRSAIRQPVAGGSGSASYGWKHNGQWLTISAEFAGVPFQLGRVHGSQTHRQLRLESLIPPVFNSIHNSNFGKNA